MSSVRLEKVHKYFGKTHVIKGIDLEIVSGEFMVFVGPSGCGKSTLLRIISGLEEINSGEIYFDDKKVSHLSPSNRRIAMVFQSYALYPHMKVYENMAFGMKLAKRDPDEVRKRVMQAAEMLQLVELLERLPRELSGGQRQRVAIGRAIVRDPGVFLFDEPLSNLDAALRVAMRIEIASLHRRMEKTTMIYVTHDQVEAMTMADRICVLRDGELEQVGTPDELYSKPANLSVATFIGSPKMNLLTGEHAQAFGASTIGIRPEHLAISSSEDGTSQSWSGKIIHVENVGSDCFSFIDIGDKEPLVYRHPGTVKNKIGEQLAVTVREQDLIYRFAADGTTID